jgi:hypothetical protein
MTVFIIFLFMGFTAAKKVTRGTALAVDGANS